MAVTVRIPTTLRPLSGGIKLVEVEAGTLSEVIAGLEAQHAGFSDRLLDEGGGLRKFVNMFVDDDDVRYLEGLDTKVPDGLRCRSSPPSPAADATRMVAHGWRIVRLALRGVEC